jgi:serine/threonine protein kinase
VLLPELDDPGRVARFQREAEVLASLNHPPSAAASSADLMVVNVLCHAEYTLGGPSVESGEAGV